VDGNGGGQGGSVTLDPDMETPPYVANHDVHMMPGCYHTEYGDDDIAAGALYDNGTAVFSMGLFGNARDDIGGSIARFISLKFPELRPRRILDMGCSIGSNTLPWARTFPEAEVHAVDVAVETVGGSGDTLLTAQRAVRPKGRIVLLGVFTSQTATINPLHFAVREVELVGSMTYAASEGRADYAIALDVVADYADLARSIITHRFDLDDTRRAFETAADKSTRSIKVHVRPGGGS
jgi:threonine dehydrogenase-like Zn-dependent dehydrogenase